MNLDFSGRRVIVTGAAQGIGRAIATHFARAGAARVIGVDIDPGLTLDAPVEARVCDLTDPAAVSAVFGEIGPVDILICAAGGVRGQVGRPIETIEPADWHWVVDANLTGAFLSAQAVAPAMKAGGYGRIVVIASGAGLGVSLTGIQAYAAAKAGVIGLVRQLGHELGKFGITVNSVAPGFVRSNPTTERQWESYGAEGQRQMVERIALRRLGTVDDIASAVLFFASEQAGWVTGQTLAVDGGK